MVQGVENILEEHASFWLLRLYVNGNTERTQANLKNLETICEQHLGGNYSLEVIDLAAEPARGAADRIIALPTLVRKAPLPVRKIIGDLTDTARVLVALDLPDKAPLR